MNARDLNLDGYKLNVSASDVQRALEAWERQLDLGAQRSAEARERYERELVAQCRAFVAGTYHEGVTTEHVRVLLDWLDGADSHGQHIDLNRAPF